MTKATLTQFVWLSLLAVLPAAAQSPEWIWHPNGGESATNNEVRYFRTTFTTGKGPQKALLAVAADNQAEVFLNGSSVLKANSHESATEADVKAKIVEGENILTVRA